MEKVLKMKIGFQKTKIGSFPDTWEVKKLEDIGVFLKGKGISKTEIIENGIPCIRYGEIYTIHNYFIKQFQSFINRESANNSKKIYYGDLIFAGSGETAEDIGKCVAYINKDEAYVSGDTIILRNHNHNALFLGYLLNSYVVNKQTYKYGQGNSVVHLYASGLGKVLIPLPSSVEQEKIGQILSTWDDATEQTSNLIVQLKIRKNSLMKKLLTGKIRLKGFDDEWVEMKLGDYLKERKETNFNDLPLLSVGKNGVYPQNEDRKDSSNVDKSKYKRICVGDIGYNTMRMWQGRSALSDLEGIVSPAYTIVTPKKNASSLFFSYLFQLDEMVHKFYRHSQGMVSDTWMCKFKDFSTIKFYAPASLEEQIAIANVLESSTNEIKQLESYLNKLQNQKKGLMQQLLTGQKRVSVN